MPVIKRTQRTLGVVSLFLPTLSIVRALSSVSGARVFAERGVTPNNTLGKGNNGRNAIGREASCIQRIFLYLVESTNRQ